MALTIDHFWGGDGNVRRPWPVEAGMHEIAKAWAQDEFGEARL